MKKISAKRLKQLIEKYGLRLSLQRDISLLGYSTVSAGYKNGLKKLTGFTYSAFGVIRNGTMCCSLANADEIGKKVDAFLNKKGDALEPTLIRCMKIFLETKNRFEKMKKIAETEPVFCLKETLDLYERYYGGLGVYNAMYRSFADKKPLEIGLSEQLLTRIGNERNTIASLFPAIERFLEPLCKQVGKNLEFDGSLILWLTLEETKKCLSSGTFPKAILAEAQKRVGQYCYLELFDSNKRYLTADKTAVEKICRKIFGYTANMQKEIQGTIAFPGKVQGIARIALPRDTPSGINFRDGEILVAVHTNPEYLPIIKKSSAVVTDEGGLLSHASILSRELKKPCVVGTKIATKIFKTGDRIEVDADTGTVRKI